MTVEEKRNSIIEAVDNLPYEEQNFIVKHLYDTLQDKRAKRIDELNKEIKKLQEAATNLDERFDIYISPCAEAVH